jgi:hypothetical protein
MLTGKVTGTLTLDNRTRKGLLGARVDTGCLGGPGAVPQRSCSH